MGQSGSDTGYVQRFHAFLESEEGLDTELALINLAVPGETSTSMINDGQLDAALAEIEARNNDQHRGNEVAVITIDIGINDLLVPLDTCLTLGPSSRQCTDALFSAYSNVVTGYDFMMDEVTESAEHLESSIIVSTYANNLVNPICPLPPIVVSLWGSLIEGPPFQPDDAGLNDRIRRIAADRDVLVADMWDKLGPKEFEGPDCVPPNDDGYEKWADELMDAFKDRNDRPADR